MHKSIFHLLSLLLLLAVFSCETDKKTDWLHNDNNVRVRLNADVKSLNPYLSRGTWGKTVYELIFQMPMGFAPKTLDMVPQLVKSAPVVTDITDGPFAGGQSFTYEIWDEAVWDDGKPVTGNDYVFTLKALFNPKMPTQRYLAYLDFVKDVEVDAANPKKFTIFSNTKYILAEAAVSTMYVLPEHIYDEGGLLKDFSMADLADPAKSAAMAEDPKLAQSAEALQSPKLTREIVSGSGPYKVVEWVDEQRIILKKKENWWGDKLADNNVLLQAFPDTISFFPTPDQTATITSLKDESLDVGLELDSKQFLEMKGDSFANARFDFYTPARFAIFYTAFNNKNPKLADKRVRRAIAYAIDMDAVVGSLYDGLAERITGPFTKDKKYYDTALKPIPLNLDSARALLTAAGWTDSNNNGTVDKNIDGQLVEMKLECLYNPASNFQERFTEFMKDNLQKVGIEIERVQLEANILRERMGNRDFELSAGLGAGADAVPDDPKQLFHTDSDNPGGSNYARFGNAETNALIDEIRTTTDEGKRNELYKKFQGILYDEQPVMFMFQPLDKIAVHKRFENVIVSSKIPGVSLQHLKLKK